MEIDKEFIKVKISQHNQSAQKLHEDSIFNAGAAEGLKKLLEELEILEKQEPVKVEDLIKDAKIIGGQDDTSITNA